MINIPSRPAGSPGSQRPFDGCQPGVLHEVLGTVLSLTQEGVALRQGNFDPSSDDGGPFGNPLTGRGL